MIYPIAIRLYNSPGGFKKHLDIKLEWTLGQGIKFCINNTSFYGSIRSEPPENPYPYWHYMNGAQYCKLYDCNGFRALCIYGDYLYGFQDYPNDDLWSAPPHSIVDLMLFEKPSVEIELGRLLTLLSPDFILLPTDIQDLIVALNTMYITDRSEYSASNAFDTLDALSGSYQFFADSDGNFTVTETPDSIKKENKNMNLNISNSLLKNLRCGKAGTGYGISLFDGSISYRGHSYNGSALVETAGFEIEAGDFLFIMPSTEIKKGDVVALASDVAYYDGTNFISLTTGAKTEYVPISCFGMTFYSVVRNMLGNFAANSGNGGNAMNNLLPLMLLDKGGDSDDLMKMMLLMNGGLNFNFGAAAPKTDKGE